APAWMERLTSSSEEKAVKPQVDYKTDTAEPKYISETFRNRILGDAKNQVSVAEIYKEMLATKPSGIYNQKTRKALIEECDQVLIEDIYIKFEPYKKSLQRIEEVNIESLVNALPSFLQSLFEGRVLSPKTRSYVLNQAITLLKIVDEQRYDEGTKKYLKYNIVYAIEYSLAMAKRNLSKEKTTVLSPSNRPLLELLSTMQGDNEVEIKGAITFPHLGNENSEDIQNLHAQIEAIIETPRDPSYKKAAEYLNQIIEKAKSLALLGDNLMQIRNYWEFEDKVYEIVKGWADMVESIKTPFILAFKTSSQHDELANIQAVIISKILKPQLIVFGEMLLSTTLLIPEITAKDNQSSNDISKL
ncbi:hypothetical protein KKD70_03725, partial [Patescibacteria group bacterium]|nr:hypothetical protein [Patescibacteria group bacterium]